MRTLLTLLAALVAAAVLLTGCASPGALPDALQRLGASAAGLGESAALAQITRLIDQQA